MGREHSNTFNQGTDGELIECVEKSGFCDNILFHSASASPGFAGRTPSAHSSPALAKAAFPGNLGAPGGTQGGSRVEATACWAHPPRLPCSLASSTWSLSQQSQRRPGSPRGARPSPKSSGQKACEVSSAAHAWSLAEREWSSSVAWSLAHCRVHRPSRPPLRFLQR